jgi:nucleotide-binding universal stress UspA family protein
MMTKRGKKEPARREAGTTAGLRSLLVAVDLTPASDRVLGRIARLPLADDSVISLLHVVPGSLEPREKRDAERDARQRLSEEARDLGASLPRSIRIEPVVTSGAAAREITETARARNVELIVLGRGGGRSLRGMFLGSTAERVMRAAKLPVLAVRLAPRSAYRRPALAIDLEESASRAFLWLLRIVPPPRPWVEVIHALRSPYESQVYPSLSDDEVEARRPGFRQGASLKLGERLNATLADAGIEAKAAPWRAHVRLGTPRMIVPNVVKQGKVDLLAMGTHGYSGLAHAFLGTVAGDLLRDVACDVLVVPPGSEST